MSWRDPTRPYWPTTGFQTDYLEGVLYIFTWYATPDEKTCPICGAPPGLDGYVWVLDHIPDTLDHPRWGPVWDVRGGFSLVHIRFPWLKGECRCTTDAEGMVQVGGVNIRIEEIEYKVHNINQSLIGIQRDLVAAERIALGLVSGDLSGQMLFYSGQRLIRRYLNVPSAAELAQRTLEGGMLVGRGGRLLAAIAPYVDPAIVGIAMTALLIEFGREVSEEHLRPYTSGLAFGERETARERQRAWIAEYGKK